MYQRNRRMARALTAGVTENQRGEKQQWRMWRGVSESSGIESGGEKNVAVANSEIGSVTNQQRKIKRHQHRAVMARSSAIAANARNALRQRIGNVA